MFPFLAMQYFIFTSCKRKIAGKRIKFQKLFATVFYLISYSGCCGVIYGAKQKKNIEKETVAKFVMENNRHIVV